MFHLSKLLYLLLALALSIHPAVAEPNPAPFSKEAISILSLEPDTAIYAGTWIANTQEKAFLLLGSEIEHQMWLAVAVQANKDSYRIIAQSDPILSYENYCIGNVEMLDKWNDGNPYFWYSIGNDTQIYISISDASDDTWRVDSGFIKDVENSVDLNYYTADDGNAIIVYDVCYPQICWPIGNRMLLEHFDILSIEKESLAALEYLHEFDQSHRLGDQDATYKIIWE